VFRDKQGGDKLPGLRDDDVVKGLVFASEAGEADAYCHCSEEKDGGIRSWWERFWLIFGGEVGDGESGAEARLALEGKRGCDVSWF